MKTVYDKGVATMPNELDRKVADEHWKQLERLVAPEAK